MRNIWQIEKMEEIGAVAQSRLNANATIEN
jgi:hypothetical protein